jgi:hypothetical protein
VEYDRTTGSDVDHRLSDRHPNRCPFDHNRAFIMELVAGAVAVRGKEAFADCPVKPASPRPGWSTAGSPRRRAARVRHFFPCDADVTRVASVVGLDLDESSRDN